MKYIVEDSLGNFMRAFPTYKQAEIYKFAYGNSGWNVKIARK